MSKYLIACCTDARTPRKHVHTITETPKFRVVLGHGIEDRTVEAFWRDESAGTDASFSASVATLRAMLAEAEAYKPDATLSQPRPR